MTIRKQPTTRSARHVSLPLALTEITHVLGLVTATLSEISLVSAADLQPQASQPPPNSDPNDPFDNEEMQDAPLSQRSLVRALLLAQHRLEATIKLAIKRFNEAKADLAQFETIAAQLRSSGVSDNNQATAESLASDLINRGKRRLLHCRRTLDELDVHVHEVAVGERLNCGVHRVVRFTETLLPEVDGQISEVLCDYFTWSGERGQPQLFEAEVVVFAVRATNPLTHGTDDQ